MKASIAHYKGNPLTTDLLEGCGHFIYLRRIISNSEKRELIDDKAKEEWHGLIQIRNCIVHNNAISDHDANYVIGELSVVTTKNKMLRGKLDFFLTLTEAAVDRYFAWVKALITVCKA